MFKTFVLLFCLSVTLGVAYSATNDKTTATPIARNTSTTAKPTKGNITTKPTVTTKPTKGNITTKPTVTTKPTKGNTTTKPTAITNSTSTKPTASTTPERTTKKTTTVLPTTPPPYGTFSLKRNDTGKNTTEYCLLAQFAVNFTINYLANNSSGNSSNIVEKTGIIYLNRTNNKDVMIDGECGSSNMDAKLVLTWPNSKFYSLTMVFSEVPNGLEATSNSMKWRVKKITLNVNLTGNPEFEDATVKNFTSSFDGSSTPTYDVGFYYSCNSKDGAMKFESTTNYTVHPVFEDVKLEPFVNKTASDAFGNKKYQCYQDNPTTVPTTKAPNSDIVPIAVGCALAGLVLIVLIAYIIGRRKSHRGYEKV